MIVTFITNNSFELDFLNYKVESGGCRIPLISYFHPVRVEFRRYRNEVRQTDFRGDLQIYCKFLGGFEKKRIFVAKS